MCLLLGSAKQLRLKHAVPSGAGQPSASTADMDAQMAELNMDQYDEEDGGEALVQGVFGSGNPGMSYYRSNHEDPYITLDSTAGASDSEAEDNELRDTDFIILAARNEDDVSHLEVCTFDFSFMKPR